MEPDANEFWQELERRLPAELRGRDQEVARSVLMMLRHRIRPEEAQHLKREFPDEINELWTQRGVGLAEERGTRPIDEFDHNQFVGRVRDDLELPDMKSAAHTVSAVFAATRQVVTQTHARHVERQLPSGLKELWRDSGPARPDPEPQIEEEAPEEEE